MVAAPTKWLVSLGVATAFLATPVLAQDKSSKLHDVMAKSTKEMQQMQMTGNVDRDFAMMMKHHHQSGIDMAQIQAREGKDPEMRQQAQKIIEAQKKEIAELDRWLETKGKSSPSAKSGESSSTGGSSSGQSNSSGHSGHGSK